MENDFQNVKIGDRVWDFIHGWGFVDSVTEDSFIVHFGQNLFKIDFGYFKRNARSTLISGPRTLFWDEVKIIPPPKPRKRVKKVTKGWINIKKYLTIGRPVVEKTIHPTRSDAWVNRHSSDDYMSSQPLYIEHEYWEWEDE